MTFDLPEDLLREAKVRAIQEGKTFKDKMAELLTLGMKIVEAQEAAKAPPAVRAQDRQSMKTTIDLPDALALTLKITAARRGKRLKTAAEEFFRAAMQSTDPAPPHTHRGEITPPLSSSAPRPVRHRVKLPLIVAPPDAPRFSLTGEDIDRLLMEDEVKWRHDAAGH